METRSGPAFGKTISDVYVYEGKLPQRNTTVILNGDAEAVKARVKELLK